MKPLHGAVFCTLLGLAIWGYGSFSEGPSYIEIDKLPPTAAGISDVVTPAELQIESQLLQLKTYRGAGIDGSLVVDSQGQLIISLDLRRWFDFHLAAQGELPLAEIVELMQSQILRLPEPGRSQGHELLQAYLGYLEALQSYDFEQQKRVSEGSLDEMIARTRWQQRLRDQWFDAEVEQAFFAGDELLDNYTIERLLAQRRGADSDELAQIEANLPAAVLEMRSETKKLVNMQQQEQQMRDNGVDDEQLFNWRQQEFGEAAAKRLQQLDQKHNNWQQRVSEYLDYQQSVPLQGLDPQARERLMSIYRQKHFSLLERKRLDAAIVVLGQDS